MVNRNFHLRLKCDYDSTENNPSGLVVEVHADNKWQSFNPSVETPGFLLFVYALFSCQLRYMRINCAERNILLESSSGEIQLVAGEFWDVKSVNVTFSSKVKSGHPDAGTIEYIRERMKHCPVSTNLPGNVVMNNNLSFE